MKYSVIEVNTPQTISQFHKVVRIIYKNDKNYIQPLIETVEGVFSPEKNNYFSHGEAKRWIIKDHNNNLAGRVAAFINNNKAFATETPTGGMGFFECINDPKAAFLLFDTCKEWLSSKGMKAMDGPINFGENDNFWGLLVEGFMPQSIGMNYNPPYYKNFFEDYGFTFYYEQITNHLDLTKPFPERFWRIAERVNNNPKYRFEHFTFKNAEKFGRDFMEIYNDAWQFHENFTPITEKQVEKIIEDIKDIAVEEFIWFAYCGEEPIAFEFMIPDLNQVLKYFKGKINLWGKIRIALKGKKNLFTRTRIVIMGVKPKYQKSGIESGLFWNMDKVMIHKPKYKEIEISWVGDFNPKMRAIQEAVGSTFAKKHITYRNYFDDDAEITRSTIIPVDTRSSTIETTNN